MNAVTVLRSLGPIDAASIRRDPLLRWMAILPIGFGFLFRWAAGIADRWLAGFGYDFDPLFGSFVLLLAPMIYGVVVGFLLLDQKDDRTLTALQVTPLSARGYLTYRLLIPIVLSVLITPITLASGGFTDMGLGHQLLAGVAAAPMAALFALFLPAVARNKVQGFALMKAAGIVNYPPILAWFVQSRWQLLFGLVPTYWPAKVYWELEAGSATWLAYLLVGLLYLTFLIWLLVRRFERAMTS